MPKPDRKSPHQLNKHLVLHADAHTLFISLACARTTAHTCSSSNGDAAASTCVHITPELCVPATQINPGTFLSGLCHMCYYARPRKLEYSVTLLLGSYLVPHVLL